MDCVIDLMIEPGPLEMQAHFCLSTLRLLDPAVFRVDLHCRAELMDKFDPFTLALFERFQLEPHAINNPFADFYPAGNKIEAAAIEKDCRWRITLDTDTILTKAFFLSDVARVGRVAACPSHYRSYNHPPEAWLTAYAHYGLALPKPLFELGNGRHYIPYFNAGFVVMPNGFGEAWKSVALQLDSMSSIPEKRPWLDQISLPVAMAAKSDGAHVLPLIFNNSPNRRREDTIIYHYHRLRGLKRNKWIFDDLDRALAASGFTEMNADGIIEYYLSRSELYRMQALKT